MKHEIGINQPSYLVEDWPNKYTVFSWLEYVVTVPNPIFLVTTLKANGAANANLHSWGLVVGDHDGYSSLLALLEQTHTYANIVREGEWCLNFPSVRHYKQCFETIACNGPDNDEIADAGLTIEAAQTVRAPRIAECAINLECQLTWHRPLVEGSRWRLLVGRVRHVAVDEAAMAVDPDERLAALGLMYNVRGTVNPLNGEYYGPNTLGVLDKVMRIFPWQDEEAQDE
ncbi:MAG: flavin reductase [Anaerolineae bacterium]|nr:flavin reductase [Anaerolineae bacterium]